MTRTDRHGAMRQAAVDLASMGYSVFPASGKKPLVSWKECQSRCATAEEIEAWWTGHVDANVGLVTGAVSGVFVLDIDGPEGHAALAAHGFEVPETVRARTARGDHYVFEHPGFEVKNFAGGPSGVRLSHVDLRGDGGFVVVPPSVHPSGAQYEWVVSPFDRKPAPAPEWLLELIRPKHVTAEMATPRPITVSSVAGSASTEYLRAALEGEAAKVRQAYAGERNHQLNASAFALGQLVAAGLDEASIIGALGESAAGVGLSDKEIDSTLRSGLEAGMRDPREVPERRSCLRLLRKEEEMTDAPSLPEYPVGVLPEQVRTYVAEAAACIGCPVEMVAVPLLGYASATMGSTYRVRIKGDYEKFPVLWVVVVGQPGSGKSPADALARGGLEVLQGRAVEDHKIAHDDWQVAHAAWRQRLNKGERAGQEPEKPTLQHFFTTDATIEALASMLEESSGIAASFDEIVGWIKSMDAYNGSPGRERAQYMTLWAERTLKVDRKTRPPVYVEKPVVCIIGGVQPDMLPQLVAEAGRRDGFIDRFLWTWPRSVTPLWTEATVGDESKERMGRVFRRLRDGHELDAVVELSIEAKDLWRHWYDLNASSTQSADGLMRGVYSKADVHLARLALVLHVLGNDVPEALQLSAATLSNAIELLDYHLAHAAVVMDRLAQVANEPRTGRGSTLRQRIVARLQEHGGWMSGTEIAKELGGHIPAAERDMELARMEAKGIVQRRVRPSGDLGGRPAVQWALEGDAVQSGTIRKVVA